MLLEVSANLNVAERANTFASGKAESLLIRFSGIPSDKYRREESFCRFSNGRIASDRGAVDKFLLKKKFRMNNAAAIKTIAASVSIKKRLGLLVFIFFSLPCIASLLGTTNPGLEIANNSFGSPTFLRSNKPSEVI